MIIYVYLLWEPNKNGLDCYKNRLLSVYNKAFMVIKII